MIGIDTNVLLRFLVQDDKGQFQKAAGFIEQRLTREERGFISVATLLETVWALSNVYDVARNELVGALERILSIDVFVFQNENEIVAALNAMEEHGLDFEDALIAALGDAAGCSHTVTFDRKALRSPQFRSL